MSLDSFTSIADYVQRRRQQGGLSQQELADKLRSTREDFEGVDGMTISRWERAKISPSIGRQIALMEYFGDEPHLLLGNPLFELKQLPSLSTFHKLMKQNLVYNHVMGGHPYLADGVGDFDKLGSRHENVGQWQHWVTNYHNNLTRGRECWPVSYLQGLQQVGSTETVYYQVDNLLVGHIVMLRVSPSTLAALLGGILNDDQLTPAQLIDAGEPACLYLLSTYLGSRHICEDALTHIFLSLLEDPHNQSLGFKSRANLGVKLMDLMMDEPVGRGVPMAGEREGARYLGKYYSYVSYDISREKLLASPMLINLLRRE